jgi:hypothetical protein
MPRRQEAGLNASDAAVVRAELVALQAVLIAVFRRLAQDAPELAPTLCLAFDDAESILTGVSMRMGIEDPDRSAVAALRIVEEIRSGVIADERVCVRSSGATDSPGSRTAERGRAPRPDQ